MRRPCRRKDRTDSGSGNQLLQQLPAALTEHVQRTHPGDVAARPVQAGDEPASTGSITDENTSGTVGWHRLRCQRRIATERSRPPDGEPDRRPAPAGDRLISPQRYSMATLRPSTKPASLKPCRNAASVREPMAVVAARNPTTGIAGCCARAASGHAAAAPPSSVMNSRRFIRSPRQRWQAGRVETRSRVTWRS